MQVSCLDLPVTPKCMYNDQTDFIGGDLPEVREAGDGHDGDSEDSHDDDSHEAADDGHDDNIVDSYDDDSYEAIDDGHDGDIEDNNDDDNYEATDDDNHKTIEDDNDFFQIFGGGGFETDNGSSAECIEECEKRTGCK